MIGIISESAGVLILPKPGVKDNVVLDLIKGEAQDPVYANHLYSAAQDWKEIEAQDAEALTEIATKRYWLARTTSLIRMAIGGLEEPLEKRVLEEVEEVLASRIKIKNVLDHLLVAPLKNPNSSFMLAKSALRYGFSTVAALLDELVDLQPLLNRFTELWLGLPETDFISFSESKEVLWVKISEYCDMGLLLKANNGHAFKAQFNLLAFHVNSPLSRSGVNTLAQKLSERLYPYQERTMAMFDPSQAEDEQKPSIKKERSAKEQGLSDHEIHQNVMKQIVYIAEAVSRGHDRNAEKFLRDLIQQQTSSYSDEKHAVKSLCNIAKQCADMFRIDFEALCLEEAHRIAPHDAWTLVQLGDHMKRIGEYPKALEYLTEAGMYGEHEIAKSSEADVYSQQGNYLKAISTYKATAGWSDKLEILTAIADILRKMGSLKEAEEEYKKLIIRSQSGVEANSICEIRARIGMAEIMKQKGVLEEASQIYRNILDRADLDEKMRLFSQQGLCNILKSMGQFNAAFKIVDNIIQQYPFSTEARFVRGSILGLIGREYEGLEDLPEGSASHSWRGWLRHYYRGLLLLKLERYEEAKKSLVDEFPKAIASGEEKAVLRMAAALCFLREGELNNADEMLLEIPDLTDCRTQYLSLVLKLHSAIQKEDFDKMEKLKSQLSEIRVTDQTLLNAIVALDNKDFSSAIFYETEALLKLAA